MYKNILQKKTFSDLPTQFFIPLLPETQHYFFGLTIFVFDLGRHVKAVLKQITNPTKVRHMTLVSTCKTFEIRDAGHYFLYFHAIRSTVFWRNTVMWGA